MSIDFDRLCRALVREAADAIVYVDGAGRIRLWNKGAERIFGFSEAEARPPTRAAIACGRA